MKINKLFWIFGLIFVIGSTIVFAQGPVTSFFRMPWLVFVVNILIVWSVLFVVQLFVIRSQDTRVKVVAWIVSLVLAFLIVWNYTPRGAAYLWEAGWIAQYLRLTFLVNTIILAIAIFYIAGFLNIAPQTPQGQIGLILGSLLLAGMIAYSLPAGTWIWNENNVQNFWKYLREPKKGILTIDGKNIFESRLFIFITSTVLFAWFFTSFIPALSQSSPRLTYLMAFIIGANLASRGTTSGTLIGIGEAFAIIIIGSQVAAAFGKGWIGWIIGITLVEWIFCAVFNQSRIFQVIGDVGGTILNSTFVSTIIALWIFSLALKSPNWVVGLAVAGVGLALGLSNFLPSFVSLGLGDHFRRMLNFNICQLLATHTIVASASTGPSGIISSFFGGLPGGRLWDYVAGLGAISGVIMLYRFRNALGLNAIRRWFGGGP